MNTKTIIVVLVIVVFAVLVYIFWPTSSSAPESILYGRALIFRL